MTHGSSHPLVRKVILLTSAQGPVNAALAKGLAALGAHVHVIGSAGTDLAALASDGIKTFAADIASRPEFVTVVNHINAYHGQIDLLINNAGTSILGLAQNLTPADWEEVLQTNVLGTVNGIELIYPNMVERGEGYIVNFGSIASDVPESCAAPFATSKAFILGLDRSLGPEARHFGVSLTLVLPGFIDPGLLHEIKVVGAHETEATSAHTLSDTSAEKIASAIIDGILKRKRRIFYPSIQARFLWHLAHWFPFALRPLQRLFIKPFAEESP